MERVLNETTPANLPTLDDVALMANVSTATVSRCLNQPDIVSKKTLDRVMKAVDSLGYTPNFGARALAAKRTKTIGAIIPTMANAMFARGLQAFQERLNEKGYTLLVSSTGYDPKTEEEQIKTLLARGADGLLLIGYERGEEIYEFLKSRKVPYLISWAHRSHETHPAVGFDNQQSMSDLANLVMELGHRDIGIISAVQKGNDRATDRVKGILKSLKKAELSPESAPIVEAENTILAGSEAFAKIMLNKPKPSAVICINDVLAVGAFQRAQEMGLSIPRDVSITGFDDIEIASLVSPKLTTVHIPHAHMGALAAEQIVNLIENNNATNSIALESSIRIRGSLGTAKRQTS